MKIDRKQLLIELSVEEPVFKKEAERVIREEFFQPAVASMIEDFNKQEVTKEIEKGIDADNSSETLVASSHDHMNLFSFIGFEADDDPIEPIREILQSEGRDGPKVRYVGMDKSKLSFAFRVSAPDEDAIFRATPMPWAPGLSWAKRIEQGIPGLSHFLNTEKRKGSRSGGGIEVPSTLRKGVAFKNVSYLSGIFNRFLEHFR